MRAKVKYFNCTIGNTPKTVPLVISKKQARNFAKAFNAIRLLESKEIIVTCNGWVKNYDPVALKKAETQFQMAAGDIYRTVSRKTFNSKPTNATGEVEFVMEALGASKDIPAITYKSAARNAIIGIGLRGVGAAFIGTGIGFVTYFTSLILSSSEAAATNGWKAGVATAAMGVVGSIIYSINCRKNLALNLAKDLQIAAQDAISDYIGSQKAPNAAP